VFTTQPRCYLDSNIRRSMLFSGIDNIYCRISSSSPIYISTNAVRSLCDSSATCYIKLPKDRKQNNITSSATVQFGRCMIWKKVPQQTVRPSDIPMSVRLIIACMALITKSLAYQINALYSDSMYLIVSLLATGSSSSL